MQFAVVAVLVVLVGCAYWVQSAQAPMETPSAVPVVEQKIPQSMVLPVPFVYEAPKGDFSGPWKNGCEEAAIVMVDAYYKGEPVVPVEVAERRMRVLFETQDKTWGSNANSDAARTVELVRSSKLFEAQVVENPTREQIRAEIIAGRPVISLHRGFELGNPNIRFLATGSSYHMVVVVGYDDNTGEFIVQDTGDAKAGVNRRYTYAVLLNSVHDYNYKTAKADGPARVIFTKPNE